MLRKILSLSKLFLISLIAAAFLVTLPTKALASTCVTTNSTNFDVTTCIDAPASNPATLSGDTTVTGSYNNLTLRNGATFSRVEFRYTPPGGTEIDLASMFGISANSPATFTWHTDEFVDMTNGTLSAYVVISMSGAHTDSTPAQQTVTLSNSNSTAPTNTNTFTPTSSYYDYQPMVMAVVGDGSSNEANPETVANLMSSWNPEVALYLGDVYYKGTHEEFQNFYDSSFGVIKNITNPVVGNHEYIANNSATGYMWYWNNIPNYYSYDAGGWHFIALNTNYSKIATTSNNNSAFSNGGTGGVGTLTDSSKNWRTNQWVNQTVTVGSETHYIASNNGTTLTLKDAWTSVPSSNSTYAINGGKTTQQAWLDADLAANADKCIVAYNHHPRFSIGSHGSDIDQEEIWDSLVGANATSYLVGHDHSYQRWTAMDGDAVATTSGVNEFVIGTGGHGATSIASSDSRVLASIGQSAGYGAMKLTFHKSKYDFAFYKKDGTLFDSGSVQCQGKGRVYGQLYENGSSDPILGATVSYSGTAADGTPISGSTTSTTGGHWEINNLPAAVYSLTFSKNGYITDNDTFEVGGAQHNDEAYFDYLGETFLTTNVSAFGYVSDDAGTRIAGATVSTPYGDVTTDSNGEYVITDLGDREVPVTITKTGYVPHMSHILAEVGVPYEINFVLPTIVHSDDFESNNFNAWTTNNNFTTQTTTVHGGTYAAEGNTTSTATNLRKTLSSTYDELWGVTYFNVKSQGSGSGLGLMAFRTSSDGAIAKVYIDGTTGKLCVRNEVTLTNTCSNTIPTQNAWHSLEFHNRVGSTNGTISVYYDNTFVSALALTSQNLGTSNIGRVVLGEVNSGRTFDVVFDDLIVADRDITVPLGKIMGTTVDSETDAPIAGVSVGYNGFNYTTDDEGRFYFIDVPYGTHNVSAMKLGEYVTANHNFNVTSLAGDTYQFELVTTKGHVSGSVKDIGNTAISGATVTISGGSPQGGTSTTSDASGNYEFRYAEPGTYTVTVSKTGYASKNAQVTITAANTTTQNFNLPKIVLSDNFESGNLNNWSPVNGMTAQTSTVHFGTYAAQGDADPSGIAQNIRKNLGTTYPELYFRAYFNIKSQNTGDNISLLWFRTSSDSGIMKTYVDGNSGKLCLNNGVTSTNTCVTGVVPAQNTWHILEMRALINGTSSTHQVWLDGTEITALTSTSANLGTNNIGRVYIGETTVGRVYDFVIDDVVIQDARVGSAGGSITGTIKDAQSQATLSGATVSIPGKQATTDGSGVYTISDVAPGNYTVTASKSGYSDNTGSATVVADASTTTNISLTGNNIGSITGTVYDAKSSSPLADVVVSYSGGQTTTNGSGVYTLSGVTAGTYAVTASLDGYYEPKTESSVVVTAGNATTQNFTIRYQFVADTFEANNFNLWTTNNNMTMSTATVHAGTYAAEGNATGSSAMNLRKTMLGGRSEVYMRTYFYVNSQASGSGLGLVSFRDTSDSAIVKVYVDGNNGKLCIRNEVTLTNTCSNTVPAQDTWHSVELYAYVNGTSSTHKVFYNGSEETSLTSTTANLGSTYIGRLVLGEVNSGRTYDVFFDDVKALDVPVGQ